MHWIQIIFYCLSLQSSLEFYEDTGLDQLPQVLVNGGPLKRGDLAADNFEEAVVHTILKKTTELQRAVYDVSTHKDKNTGKLQSEYSYCRLM